MPSTPSRTATESGHLSASKQTRFRSLLRLGAFALFSLCCIGCDANQNDNAGSPSLFSLFGSKKNTKTVTKVHPDVGAVLVREPAFPSSIPTPPAENNGTCTADAVEGRPPDAHFVKTFIDGQNAAAWKVEGMSGQPPLAVVNVSKDFKFEIWELGPDGRQTFVRRRNAMLDPAQASWVGFYASGVSCLPGKQLLISAKVYAPSVKSFLYRYDVAQDRFTTISPIERHVRDLDKYFETLVVSPDTKLVLYYTDNVRLAPEIYTNAQQHLLLFSPRHPQGLEVLNIGNDDGSVVRWAVVGKTLWLDTLDSRKRDEPVQFVWSLDLSKVL